MKAPTPSRSKCPCCGSGRIRIFYEALGVPVNSVLLLATHLEACEFPTGDIVLGFCEDCGFIYNVCFDIDLVEYSGRCEETQGFSPTFRTWQETQAHQLVDRYRLREKTIVEIGCGKGEFLTLLCEMGAKSGVGFDPGYLPERNLSPAADRITFIRDYYSERYTNYRGDFLCCKMTLEHISDAAAFIGMVRRSLEAAEETIAFFQVPDTLRILKEVAFWDIYYEHCSYFSVGSLARVFRRAGFEVLSVGREYGNQYLTIEARPAYGAASSPLADESDLELLSDLVSRFSTVQSIRVADWRDRLRQYRGHRTVVWGSGSKGVSFLTALDSEGVIEYVVDVNPNKHGYYMAKTGQQIVAPAFLREYQPEMVIIMNPVYREEIVAELQRLGLAPEVFCA